MFHGIISGVPKSIHTLYVEAVTYKEINVSITAEIALPF